MWDHLSSRSHRTTSSDAYHIESACFRMYFEYIILFKKKKEIQQVVRFNRKITLIQSSKPIETEFVYASFEIHSFKFCLLLFHCIARFYPH